MSITDILTELDIPFRRHGESPHVSSNFVGVVCPFCDQGRGNFGLGISLTSSAVICWSCGPHRLGDALSLASGRPLREVLALLKGIAPEERGEPIQGQLRTPPGLGPLLPVHKRYLRLRGFDPGTLATTWGVQGIGLAGNLSWRLFFPVTLHGKVVSWTTRALGDASPRYANARPEWEDRPIKSVLYGSDLAEHSIIVCEGPLDAITVGPGGVATLGTGWTAAQLALIGSYPLRCILFDAEEEAQRRARQLCRELAPLPGQTINLVLESGKDAAESDPEEIREIRRKFLEDHLTIPPEDSKVNLVS